MGGSILGAETIYQFLNHKVKKKFIFLDNLKSNFSEKDKFKKKVNLIISKSGNTIETILNSSYLINQNKKNKNIFITEKKTTIYLILPINLNQKLLNIKIILEEGIQFYPKWVCFLLN